MTFKYGLTLPVTGANKLRRFKAWAKEHFPDLEYKLPPQAPIKTETLTIRLRSKRDGDRLLKTYSGELPQVAGL